MSPERKGMRDFWKGKYFDNPYPVGTIQHGKYQYGQDRAYFQNLKQVKKREKAQSNARSQA